MSKENIIDISEEINEIINRHKQEKKKKKVVVEEKKRKNYTTEDLFFALDFCKRYRIVISFENNFIRLIMPGQIELDGYNLLELLDKLRTFIKENPDHIQFYQLSDDENNKMRIF